jgi:DNA-binding response OmpR family regulator
MRSSSCLVLVADDDDDLRDALSQVLETAGFRVVAASDGLHALEQLARGVAPCAILLDWMMPRVDGERFLCERSRSSSLASIPVLVMSASHVPAADLGIQGFLPKPFAAADLLPKLRAVCDERCPKSKRPA